MVIDPKAETMKKTKWLVMAIILCIPGLARAKTSDKNLSNALYYQTLVNFTCRLQIDYYTKFDAYLDRTNASGKPTLIPYYLGLAHFELGDYKQAARFFKNIHTRLLVSKVGGALAVYQYYSQTMLAASLYRLGDKSALEKLVKEREDYPRKWFLGYVLLRLNYRTELAKELLAGCPDDYFGEVTYKWIRYRLGELPIEDIKIAKFKLKRPEFEEKYDKIKLKKGGIALSIKYFNPAQISLLKEISLHKALKTFDAKDMENYAPIGEIIYLLGNYKTALGYLEDYQKAFPLDFSTSILLGRCYYASGLPEKARHIWDWIKKSGGRKVKRELALVLSTIPQMRQQALDIIKSTKDKEIGKSRRFDVGYYRKYKDYYQTLGRIYLNGQEFNDAADYLMFTYERSRREQPRTYDRTYLISLGYALAKTGRYKEAIDFSLKGAASLDLAAHQAFHAVNYGLSMLGYE